MFVYQASEKDCVGQDGEGVQECVICFEDFAVGDEMGRLECLCKFHRVSLPIQWFRDSGSLFLYGEMTNEGHQTCIRQWWDKKGAGVCPVHAQGET